MTEPTIGIVCQYHELHGLEELCWYQGSRPRNDRKPLMCDCILSIIAIASEDAQVSRRALPMLRLPILLRNPSETIQVRDSASSMRSTCPQEKQRGILQHRYAKRKLQQDAALQPARLHSKTRKLSSQ